MDQKRTGAARAAAWLGAVCAIVVQAAAASPLPSDPLEQRCWQTHTRERTQVNLREPTGVEFSNLRDGWRVRSPFSVEFAVRGMGVVPAGLKFDGGGHHHLLVNRDLPLNVGAQLPFDDSHRHFGKGQTSTVLDLPPGRHRLRLLFADHEHRPYFVFSREISVQVLGPRSRTARPTIDPANFAATCRAWYEDETSTPAPPEQPLRFLNVRAGETLVSPVNLRLGVDTWGICAPGARGSQPVEKAGHFIVEVADAAGRGVPQVSNLSSGATQMNLYTAPGDYRLRLRLVDPTGRDLLPAHEIPVRVARQDAL